MTDAKSAWTGTGEQLTALGAKLSAHYKQQSQTSQTGQTSRDAEPTGPQSEDALKRLTEAAAEAAQVVGSAVGSAARDEAVRADVKQVGRSLVSALEVTAREVSTEVGKFLRKSSTPPQPQTPTDPTPPAKEPGDPTEP